ncbi:MAG: site-2 protease family protein [Candidatus Marinimicrobia bacterium]|nr:site-2 protease family protein [Candidatus Neomarinimicrobiota bacterium]
MNLDPSVQILLIPVIIFALSFHEYAHAWAAYRLGDPTASSMGRLTLNPMAHLDPFGAIALYLIGFGWAKPVPVDYRYLRNPKQDMLWIALAGPASNFAMALISGLLLRFLWTAGIISGGSALTMVLVMSLQINLMLGMFNFLPIPPLDGSKILAGLIPNRHQNILYNMELYGPKILFAIILIGMVTRVSIIGKIISPFIHFFMKVFTLGLF